MARIRSPVATVAQTSTASVRGGWKWQVRRTGRAPGDLKGVPGGELDELFVRLPDRLTEHPVDRPLAAEDGEEAFGEESVRRERAGRYGAA